MRHRVPRAVLLVVVVVVGTACAPDGPDVYTVAEPDAAPATRPPLPTTTTTETVASGHGGDEPDAAPESAEPATFAANGDVVEVRSLDNSFIPPDIEIEAGTAVNWINGGRNDHDVLPVDETLDWGVDRDTFVPGTEYTHLFDTPGDYPYYCSIHGTKDVGMIGSVVVVAPS